MLRGHEQISILPVYSNDSTGDFKCITLPKPVVAVASTSAYLIPFCSAAKEMTDTLMSLAQASLKNKTPISIPQLVIASIGSFMAEAGLSAQSTVTNLKETYQFIKTREIPEDWVKLTRKQEALAIGLTILSASYGAPSEGIQTFYFVSAVPGEYQFTGGLAWQIISGVLAGGTFLTILGTETKEGYETYRNMIARKKKEFTCKFSEKMSPALGGSLTSLKSFQDCVQGYIAIKTTFGIGSLAGKTSLGTLAALNIFPNFFFNGGFAIEKLDEFFGYIKERSENKIQSAAEFLNEAKKWTTFSCALALAVYIALLRRPLNEEFYHDTAKDFGFDNRYYTDPAFIALSYMMMMSETLGFTASLYQAGTSLVSSAGNIGRAVVNKASSACYKVKSFCSSIGNWCGSRFQSTPEERASLLENGKDDREQSQDSGSDIENVRTAPQIIPQEVDQEVDQVAATQPIETSAKQPNSGSDSKEGQFYSGKGHSPLVFKQTFNNFKRIREEHERAERQRQAQECPEKCNII